MKCNWVIALFPMTHLNGVYVSLLCTNLALAHREIVIRCRGHHNILSSHILVMHTAQKSYLQLIACWDFHTYDTSLRPLLICNNNHLSYRDTKMFGTYFYFVTNKWWFKVHCCDKNWNHYNDIHYLFQLTKWPFY